MAPSEIKWKAYPRKINGQSKPFIDKNLQIQIPDLEACSPSSIKDKCHSVSSENWSLMLQEADTLEAELNKAILEAQQTQETWKKMLAKLYIISSSK